MTGILVIGSLADVGARYTYLLFGWDGAAGSKAAVMVLAVAYIVVLTAVCILGTELSARPAERDDPRPGGGVARSSRASRSRRSGAVTPARRRSTRSWSLVLPLCDRRAGRRSIAALLIGVFTYWGWESAVNLCEETSNSRAASRVSRALASTVILLVTYVVGGSRRRRVRGARAARPSSTTTRAIFGVLGARRARLALGQARAARDRHLGGRVDPDDDHPGLAHRALDGPLRRVTRASSRGSTRGSARPTSPQPWSRSWRSSGTCRRNVDLGELPLRLALGALR